MCTNAQARALSIVHMPVLCIRRNFNSVPSSQKKLISSNAEKKLTLNDHSDFAKWMSVLRNFHLRLISFFVGLKPLGFHENFCLFLVRTDGCLPASYQHATRIQTFHRNGN